MIHMCAVFVCARWMCNVAVVALAASIHRNFESVTHHPTEYRVHISYGLGVYVKIYICILMFGIKIYLMRNLCSFVMRKMCAFRVY